MHGSSCRLVVGLGNPGPRYRRTRHNVGFEVLDRVAARERLLFESTRSLEGYEGPDNASVACLAREACAGVLVKPRTFMNLSGEAVLPLAAWAELDPADLLVVYDDLDLPPGKLRIRPHGSSGGQRGMVSIIEHLETDRFPRLRVGIGRTDTDAARHVLSTFAPDERKTIDASLEEAAEAVLFWLGGRDIEEVMTRFHSRWNRDGLGGPARTEEES